MPIVLITVLVSSSVTDTLFINSIERELEDQKL